MSRNYRNMALTAIRYILGLLFLFSGIGKLIHPGDARYLVELVATEVYWLIEYTGGIVLAVSIIELLIGILLLWGRRLTLSLSMAAALFLFFTALIGYFYLEGFTVASCGCFGAFGGGGGLASTLLRNLVLLALALGGLILLPRKKEEDPATV